MGEKDKVKADESFHITVNVVLNLVRRAREIFESSEIDGRGNFKNHKPKT